MQALFIPKRGFKGQSTSREQYNRFLGYLSKWLEMMGLTIGEMTAAHWDEFIDFRGWAYKAERLGLSAIRYWLRMMEIFEHPLFEV